MTADTRTPPKTIEDVMSVVDEIARTIIAPNAVDVDEQGRFPRESIDALGKRGILGLLVANECGGLGLGLDAACQVVQRIAVECPSTGMIVTMHFTAASLLEKYGSVDVRKAIAAGTHLTTLAFSEAGSRSHFWAPLGTAEARDSMVALNARKSFSTAASNADSYVWTSKSSVDDERTTVWYVPSDTEGLTVPAPFNGLGLRGNDSAPIIAENALIPANNHLGGDGEGFGVMMETLPYFNPLAANVSVGLMKGALARVVDHVSGTRFAHLQSPLSDLPTIRAYVARMQIRMDMADALQREAVQAIMAGRSDAMLRVLEVKAAAGECASEMLGMAMRVCGGAAYRKDVAVERYFRDSQAATVMTPTTDMLYDFIGKVTLNLPMF